MGGQSNVLALVVVITVSTVVVESHAHNSHACHFPAIFNFGDSNSDTGAVSAAFGRVPHPYGETFFGQPSGRYSDGRLIIDFLAETLGLPYLGAFLDSLGTNFHHGANFAASGATIEPATGLLIDSGFNLLSLKIQLSQFDQFKNRTIELYRKGEKFDLPRPEDFSKALYTTDIGQNDLHFKLITVTLKEVFDYIPYLVNQTSLAIEVSAFKSSLG